ncbi:CinA family protein [Marinimicrobium agarilyticum]|uniref:CinA family protein n=1 Tax=Marinimicrobium agarilyticum TaxID=306546 RepID=UPI00041B635E|nr:nicotinamide-nucleotide amidohydrolase family protein [Marinimicrobium agarilyticum]
MIATTPPESTASPDAGRHRRLAEQLGEQLQSRGWRVATAESCTGGGIAAALTEVAGSSAWFEYGLVTYANRAKQQLLGVSEQSLEREGAVSEAVVREMAAGALRVSGAELAIAVSGIAGPAGGTPEKPVGTVWLGWALGGENPQVGAHCYRFEGDRASVREQSVVAALEILLSLATLEKTTV